MGRSIFTNGRVFDGTEVLEAGTTVVVEGERRRRVARPRRALAPRRGVARVSNQRLGRCSMVCSRRFAKACSS